MTAETEARLIYMANQIAREFASQRPREAVEATWDHLWHFWDPRMRAMILAHLQEGGAGLDGVALLFSLSFRACFCRARASRACRSFCRSK